MRKRVKVNAVWDSDLESLLRSLDMFEPLLAGNVSCAVCERTVDLDNLGAIVPREDGALITCTDALCIREFTRSAHTAGT